MLRANWAIRFLISVVAVTYIGGRAPAQQGQRATGQAVADNGRVGPPADLKLSPLAKTWFEPAARAALSDGKRSITVPEEGSVWHGDLAGMRFLPDVNRLCLMGGFSGKDLVQLKGLKTLEFLRIGSNVFMTDKDLEGIATLSNLRELEILQALPSDSDITDRGLEILSRLPRLQVLELGNVNITETGLRHLKKFPELRELRLASTRLTWDSLGKFPKLDKLYALTISCVPYNGEAPGAQRARERTAAPDARRVGATARQGTTATVGAAGEKPPARPPKNLKLSPLAKDWFLPTATSAPSDGKESITVIEDDQMWPSDLAALRFLPNVNRLRLGGGFSGEDLAQMNGLGSIEYLLIDSHISVNDRELEGIATLPNLRDLEILQAFPGDGITDRGLETLSRLPHLQVLELGNVSITEAGLRHLKKLPELRELRLASTRLTWDSLVKFPKLGKLRTLTIWCVPRNDPEWPAPGAAR